MGGEEHPAVTRFREYIRIKTVQPEPEYAECVAWLRGQAKQLNADCRVTEYYPGKPVVLMTIVGSQPELPSILLNSHTDVVPVFPEHWKYEPFSAHKDEQGNVYGRGTQDMKCVGVQYMEAIRRLQQQGHQFTRTVHLSFVPDEEIGGARGMKLFVQSEDFKKLNVGFALDEGYANPTDKYFLFYGERCNWWFWLTCSGQPGHGSQFLPNNAGKKIQSIVNSAMEFRDEQEAKLKSNPDLQLGDVVTVNLTMMKGGVQFNVVPSELCVAFDMRIPPTEDLQAMEGRMRGWCEKAGGGIDLNFTVQVQIQKVTCVDDGKSVWWDTFSAACKKQNITLQKAIFPAGTDSRYLREIDIPALGFSPMNNTPILLHDHNEFLNEKVFLRGIDIYCTVIADLAALPKVCDTTVVPA